MTTRGDQFRRGDALRQAEARLALSLLVEPGDPRLGALLRTHDPVAVLESVRRGSGPGADQVPAAWGEGAARADRDAGSARTRATAHGLRWVVPGDREWPAALDDLDHVEPLNGSTGAPLGLWLRGPRDLAELAAQGVAIVGARAWTAYGSECAAEIAADVADQGGTVVSGAAFGIDAAAHRGALTQGAPTVAVLACGADVEYPRTHASLLRRIAHDGLVVSEQAPGQVPMRSRFLSRNRVIAALGTGTVVVEAARRSGSLNTLHWADALGRVTMGVPGPVTSQQSAGVHQALRDGRAVLVTHGRDVLDAVAGVTTEVSDPESAPDTERDRLGRLARRVLDCLSFEQARSTADVAASARGSRADVAELLAALERQGLCAHVGDRWLVLPRGAATLTR
jgi:DNA processing protein